MASKELTELTSLVFVWIIVLYIDLKPTNVSRIAVVLDIIRKADQPYSHTDAGAEER